MTRFADIPLPARWSLAGDGPFAGAWAGYWGDVIPHVLLACGGGSCVYAVGAVPVWHIQAGSRALPSDSVDGRLVLDSPGLTVDYWLEGSGDVVLSGGVAASGSGLGRSDTA